MSCIHLSCQENCWRMVNSMGKFVFVSDNSNQFTKLENFGEMFPFSRKEKQDDCFFFLNKTQFVRKRTFYSIFGEGVIRTKSKPRNMISGRHSERRPRSFVRAFQSGIPFLFEFAFYLIHIFKSHFRRCQLLWKSAFVCGQIVSI